MHSLGLWLFRFDSQLLHGVLHLSNLRLLSEDFSRSELHESMIIIRLFEYVVKDLGVTLSRKFNLLDPLSTFDKYIVTHTHIQTTSRNP